MKLNHHARELKNTLEVLDFRYDERESQRRGGGAYCHHHAEPEQYIKVFGNLTPAAAKNRDGEGSPDRRPGHGRQDAISEVEGRCPHQAPRREAAAGQRRSGPPAPSR